MTEVEQPPQNGIDLSAAEEDDINKVRPADIEQDVREMERRKRVEAIMGSKLFREELERIVDCARDNGNTDGLFQQLSDIVGVPASRVGSVFKSSNCMVPINDIRGVESMGYAKGEKILRCKLAAAFRLLDLNGWTQGLGAQITARLKVDQEYFLVNPYGLLYHEITASSLNKVDMQGNIVEQGTTNFGVNKSHFVLHSIVHAARPDIRCAIYIGCSPVVAIASLKAGLLPLTKDACVLGELSSFSYTGYLNDEEERIKLVRNLGPNSKVMLLTNHGALCCGETIEEAFFAACHIVQACETQLKLLPVGLDNLVLISDDARKMIYEQSRRPPEDLEKKFAAATAITDSNKAEAETKEGGETTVTTTTNVTTTKVIGQPPKWRVGGAEFEALMRMLDNAGYRTGYIYRHPLIKSDPPKPKNDVELPPAVSSLGYLLEEEELFRQGIWKKGDLRKGGDRSRWLNSPNVYQKVEVLETGTPDPKKITKWVAEGSPTHSTPVRIDDPLQFVPVNTNPREFKKLQQQIKDNRRADKISAGPQSHILEGVTWDEANRIKDATVSSAGDHVVLMGAASKGIIQRGFQHNATVYKTPYAKNPFDNVTDDELNEYKRTVERKKKSIHGEYTDTDFSESEALSSLQTSGTQQQTKQTTTTTTTTTAAVSQSEPEDISEHQVMRIQTQQAPVPSQPEVVLSDASLCFINGERSHTVTNRKPPTGRDAQMLVKSIYQVPQDPYNQEPLDISCHSVQLTPYQSAIDDVSDRDEEDISCSADHHRQANCSNTNISYIHNTELIHELKSDLLFQRQKDKLLTPTNNNTTDIQLTHTHLSGNGGNLGNISSHKSPLRSKCKLNRLGSNNALDNSSYYSCCYDHTNNTCKSGSDCCSNIYDIASSNIYDIAFSNIGSDFTYLKKAYTKSIDCQTPNICDVILESLQKPANMSASQQDLVWNKPFLSQAGTPFSTPENQNTPRKARGDHIRRHSNYAKKSNSPYRTVSHFGFISPQREPEPNHKHVPINTDPKKYVPLRRSISCEEVFSSPRYLDLCEHCFEQIVRTRLRNLGENYLQPETASASVHSPIAKNISSMVCGDDKGFTHALVIAADSSGYDIPSSEEEPTNEEGHSVFTYQLETVIEVEERDSSEDHVTNSTFIDRITRMNYSEESSNVNFLNTPHTVSSHISLAEIEEDYEMTSPFQESISENFQRLNLNKDPKVCNNNLEMTTKNADGKESFVSVTEIWDFGNWLESVIEEPTLSDESLKSTKSSETQTSELSLANKAPSAMAINQDLEKQPSRLLMNREERTRRKLEFQELWEDHVRCGENREQCGNAGGYSDTESAIDETQHPTSGLEIQQTEEDVIDRMSSIDLTDEDTEIFEGSSLVIAHIYHSNQNNESANKSHSNNEENFDREDYESTSSRLTFNISEQNSSEENLLFRKNGSTNIAGRINMCGADGQIDQSFYKKLHTNETLEDYDMEDVDNLTGIQLSSERVCQNEKKTPEKQQYEENNEEFAKATSETPCSLAITSCTESEMHLKDFNDLVRQQYDAHSNVSENFEAITCNINFIDDQMKIGEIFEQVEQISTDILDDKHKEFEGNLNETTLRATKEHHKESADNERLDDCHKIDDDDGVIEQEINTNQTLNENEENKDNKDLTDEEFSSLERKILEKIEINQLSKSEKIFDKIETSIRNKMTPSKLELLIKEQALRLCRSSSSNNDNDNLYKLTSTPNKDVESLLGKSFDLKNFFKSDDKLHRRSQSLTQLNDNSSPLAKFNKTSTPPVLQQKKQPTSARSSSNSATPSPCSSQTSMNSNTKRRNFILENIRNASVPRHTPQIKRLQGNTQAIFGKNPFGPRVTTAVNCSTANKSDQQQIVSQCDCSASAVYSFQSKLVRGSPRFWVSMTQSPNEKLQQPSRKPNRNSNSKSLTQPQKLARKITVHEEQTSFNNFVEKTFDTAEYIPITPSSVSSTMLATAKDNDVTKVDAEINALGEEIQQIQPRLETYKRKLKEFGDRVSKCARNMDECVATQEEIANEQRELKERIILQQFTEEISCRIEAFSLSETED